MSSKNHELSRLHTEIPIHHQRPRGSLNRARHSLPTKPERPSKTPGLWASPLIRYLIDTLDVDSGELAEMASAEFGVPVFDLNAMNREMLPEQQIDAELMVKHHAVPLFRRGHHLFVAVSDPLNLSALDEFKFAAGINTDAVLVEDEA